MSRMEKKRYATSGTIIVELRLNFERRKCVVSFPVVARQLNCHRVKTAERVLKTQMPPPHKRVATPAKTSSTRMLPPGISPARVSSTRMSPPRMSPGMLLQRLLMLLPRMSGLKTFGFDFEKSSNFACEIFGFAVSLRLPSHLWQYLDLKTSNVANEKLVGQLPQHVNIKN